MSISKVKKKARGGRGPAAETAAQLCLIHYDTTKSAFCQPPTPTTAPPAAGHLIKPRMKLKQLEQRLARGADLICDAEARGEIERADWLAEHFRKLLGEYEELDAHFQEVEHGG